MKYAKFLVLIAVILSTFTVRAELSIDQDAGVCANLLMWKKGVHAEKKVMSFYGFIENKEAYFAAGKAWLRRGTKANKGSYEAALWELDGFDACWRLGLTSEDFK